MDVSRELLGAYLHRILPNGKELIGRVVETEAYAMYEPASHAYRGKTPRTSVMFGDAGYAYVYFTYGMYWCLNVVANEEGKAEAVLIRGIEPIEGLEEMRARRPKAKREIDLTNGPGKICQAFELARGENKLDMVDGDILWFTKGDSGSKLNVGITTRIGINVAKELPWRFFIDGNPFVSPGKPS